MSFTAEVKDELSRVPATCSHCDKAVLAALVRIEGTLFVSGKNRYRVEIATDAPSVARLVIKLLHELYRLKTNLTVRRSVLHKTPNYLIEVPAQPQLAAALVDMGVLSPEGGLVLGVSEQLGSQGLLCGRISAWRLPGQRIRIRPSRRFPFRGDRRNRGAGRWPCGPSGSQEHQGTHHAATQFLYGVFEKRQRHS